MTTPPPLKLAEPSLPKGSSSDQSTVPDNAPKASPNSGFICSSSSKFENVHPLIGSGGDCASAVE